jgi:hypothetical protein
VSLIAGLILLCGCQQIRWPYEPGDTTYELGNNYGEHQNYGGGSYYHNGIDILSAAPRPMYAVEDGTVTHITDPGGGLYCGIMIGEPTAGGRGWLYWHVDSPTIAVAVGDVVSAGDYIGDIVNWPVYNFHHVHFMKVEGTGGYPWAWAEPIGNPLSFLTPNTDNADPVIDTATATADFLFCENETSTYLAAGNLKGKVDVVVRIRDRFNAGTNWDMVPYSVAIEITPQGGGAAVLSKNAVLFSGALGSDATVIDTVYKDDATADTLGNYTTRVFWFVATNSDGDNLIETVDQNESWDTTTVSNGDYVVTVRARDQAGNEVTESMTVTVNN